MTGKTLVRRCSRRARNTPHFAIFQAYVKHSQSVESAPDAEAPRDKPETIANPPFPVLIALAVATAEAQPGDPTPPELPALETMRPVPITGLQMVQADEQIVFVSRNSRFLCKHAELYDSWNQTWIRSLDELDAAAFRLIPPQALYSSSDNVLYASILRRRRSSDTLLSLRKE
jgi:hypothetical protein